jgi:hypothetical protein
MYKPVEGDLKVSGCVASEGGEVHTDTHGTRNTTAAELGLQLFPLTDGVRSNNRSSYKPFNVAC